MNVKTVLPLLLLVGCLPLIAQKSYQLQSPDNKLQTVVSVANDIRFSLFDKGAEMVAPSPVSMTLQDGEVLGRNPQVQKVLKASVDKTILSPFYKKESITNEYNEMTISFKGGYTLIFRLYNEGMAYRFVTKRNDHLIITNEEATYNFSADYKTFSAYVNSKAETFEKQFFNSFEQPYVNECITKLNDKRLMILPLLVDMGNGTKLCITEADLEDYPGMFLTNTTSRPSLKAIHAGYPKTKEQGGHNRLQMLVKERENYIAKTNGARSFPWRVLVVSRNDKELANCDMVYRLASPSRLSDISWIKPGKVAWDWWNDWNLYGVDFRAGINNPTYKYYIDFAAKQGLEYVILDEGWAKTGEADMMDVIPEIDLKELVAYAKSKNVELILWAGYYAFDRDMEHIVKHYSDLGIKGFKIDFMDRDDQEMVNFLYRAADVCAKNKMLVDFHGISKPTGLQRTYPNVLNYEGVNGLEQLKWSPQAYDMVGYDVTIPFIRMIAGPMDYTQGAMRNASRSNYYAINSEPMSQGTRCHQLATYVVFESPVNMLCDSPSNYLQEEECASFISSIPTVWDETIALDGKVSEYIVLARRHGTDWYVGGLTNWTTRELTFDLSFLGEGDYKIELFKDGINADRAARDYKKEVISVPAGRLLTISMAPGGGFAAHIHR